MNTPTPLTPADFERAKDVVCKLLIDTLQRAEAELDAARAEGARLREAYEQLRVGAAWALAARQGKDWAKCAAHLRALVYPDVYGLEALAATKEQG